MIEWHKSNRVIPAWIDANANWKANDDLVRESPHLFFALEKMLADDGDHMTACEKTMGATHPCTCGADDARKIMAKLRGQA